jgi:methyl-accepting chemotaxis protein
VLDKKKIEYLDNFTDEELVEYLAVVRDYFGKYTRDLTKIINEEPEDEKLKLARAFVKAGATGKPIMKEVLESTEQYKSSEVEEPQDNQEPQDESKFPNADRFLNNWEKVLRVKEPKEIANEQVMSTFKKVKDSVNE